MDKRYKIWELEEGKSYECGGIIYKVNGKKLTCLSSGSVRIENCPFGYGWMMMSDFTLVEPEIDWSKVPVDTKVLVSDDEYGECWFKRHFAMSENNVPLVFASGETSWSTEKKQTRSWLRTKLAEDNPAYYKEV